ncbi:MAG: VOC family protein [Acidobacteriota bacterium]
MKIDHVTLAGPDLSMLRARFAGVGLRTEYGGQHDNGVTHMSVLPFEDGSYIELISTVKAAQGSGSPLWAEFIEKDGGPCAWAVQTTEMDSMVQRLRRAKIAVHGPELMHRRTPEGEIARWRVAFLGDGGPGAVLPFLIEDLTPREVRVPPPPAEDRLDEEGKIREDRVLGVAAAVLAVEDLEESADLFQRGFGMAPPTVMEDDAFEAKVALFRGTPVVLAQPLTAASPLRHRLDAYGQSPACFLLRTPDLALTRKRLEVKKTAPWLRGRVAWLSPDVLGGRYLGLFGRSGNK